jgi:(1->4)-alpha-D-glucan 1-alpha-D-glucosylmutase
VAAERQPTKQIPLATYRLQFNRQFTLQQAVGLTGYLSELGISHCYASPLFEARADSPHGYDVCRLDQINSNLGAKEDFARFTSRLSESGLGLVLDFVPNHMAADISNCWWRDVLEKGRRSKFASFFDIDWEHEDVCRKILLPVLEEDYEKVLRSGKLRLVSENGNACIAYYDKRFPVAPESAHLTKGKMGHSSPDELRALLAAQHYELISWRDAATRINYRRFFDVSALVSLRMELAEVFEAAHAFLFRLVDEGTVNGLRVDHPDGLWNPKSYFSRLRRKSPRRVYIVAEKILSTGERLPPDWPVDGTTGYDFLNCVNGIFVDAKNERACNRIYREFSGVTADFASVAYQSKKQIIETSFGSEVTELTRRLQNIAIVLGRDRPESDSRATLIETIACFPIYRTYISEQTKEPSADPRRFIQHALEEATRRNPFLNSTAMDLLRDVLLLRLASSMAKLVRQFMMRFQQLTAPVMAKGVEDTAFYRFHRFISLNEVGGDPKRFGITVEEFHEHNRYLRQHWPHSMLATATHDTKRGEDVRARLNVLSEMPDTWSDAVTRWSRLNARHKTIARGESSPDANDEYLLYQTLVGAWPDDDSASGLTSFRERISSYMLKAIREAKLQTNWTDPDHEYESAVTRFVEKIFSDDLFLADFRMLQQKVAFFGTFNSLAQVLLKSTSPGVPDFYQGTELWDLSLVDPDNRRPVDFEIRRRLPRELNTASLGDLLENWRTGRIKMFVTQRALQFRRSQPALFQKGEYLPLVAKGKAARNVISFARTWRGCTAVTIAPRFVLSLMKGVEKPPIGANVWGDTRLVLPQGFGGKQFHNVFTGQQIPTSAGELNASEALKNFPVALLSSG